MVDKDDKRAVHGAETALKEIFEMALSLGGTITGEHGVGSAKLPYLTARLGSGQMQLQRGIKSVFDPAGVLNPGRLGS